MLSAQPDRVEIPHSLQEKLLEYRRRVWWVKLLEASAGAVIGVLAGFLAVYALDRIFDTPRPLRWVIFAAAALGCGLIPLALERWVWRRRRLDQLARLLTRTYPNVGDQLLGILELSGSESERTRSPQLVEAAIAQVADDVGRRDLSNAVPNPRHKRRLVIAGAMATAAGLLLVFTTAAGLNAWNRFLAPWSDAPRYTFAAVQNLPTSMVVAHGEPFELDVALAEKSRWQPPRAEARLPGRAPESAERHGSRYRFKLPGQIRDTQVSLRVGDFTDEVSVTPMLRPELQSLEAEIRLPDYLKRTQSQRQSVRGSTMTAVTGSTVSVSAQASRRLDSASANQEPLRVDAAGFTTEPFLVDRSAALRFQWSDEFGLSGKDAFQLKVEAVDDQPPAVACEGVPRRKVLLDSEVITFSISAVDDFGIKEIGYEWEGLDPDSPPVSGEGVLGVGDPDAERIQLAGAFSAEKAGIKPQPISFRVYAVDYLPNRKRTYSAESVFYVLTADQHAVWIAEELSRWQRMSLDVRDRELRLHETNRQLRSLPGAELDRPETRRELRQQASRERANGRRLEDLVQSGEELLKEAMRNPEIGVGHLDRWAEMMQVLKDISGNRMPSVADLLKEASQAETLAGKPTENSKESKSVGQNRLKNKGAGDPAKPSEETEKKPLAPSVVDIESSHQQPKAAEAKDPTESPPKQGRLTLPTTRLAGNGKSDQKPPQPEKSEGPVDEAVETQKDLLAEFDKLADELSEVLANLEGSTLVKRLKAASRAQQKVAARLASVVPSSFGVPAAAHAPRSDTFTELSDLEADESENASFIMDDMSAYFQRSRYARFKAVLDDMRDQDVTGGLRDLSDDLGSESGLSVSQAEYWSETFDRWAEDLVEVTKSGACPGCKAKGSLPPSIVLEVLQVLEGEVKLREETRVAEQKRPATEKRDRQDTVELLSGKQQDFRERIDNVVSRIGELPEAEQDFAKELALLKQVSLVMTDATRILSGGETGAPAIAAETEAIELLLQSKRFNPGGGGGGGSTPGGGGGGDTNAEALAMVGTGVNAKQVRSEMTTTHAAGTSGPALPEEFRSGLNEYFNQFERWNQR